MQKVALCVDLSEIFERYKAKVQARISQIQVNDRN